MKTVTLNLIKHLLIILTIISSLTAYAAEDTVMVQTLTFNDITKRQGIWKFPDSTETFRKILMYYTLKCDPRTTRDKYDCGEWDYLTYNMVNIHTGRYDSTQNTAPFFKVGASAPDTVYYRTEPTFSSFQHYQYSTIIDSVISETGYNVFDSDKNFSLSSKPSRIQFILLKQKMKDMGFTKGRIDKIKFKIKDIGGVFKNFTVKIVGTSMTSLQSFDNETMNTAFQHDMSFDHTGWYELNLTTPYTWSGFNNILVEISYDSAAGNSPGTLFAIDSLISVQANDEDYYLYFDGANDYIDCGNIDALNGISAFTIEGWIRIDQWKAWNTIFTKAGKIQLETGPTSGQLYCEVRNPDNTYGYANGVIGLNQWTHVAMVYDGTQATNDKKLRLYVNGTMVPLIFSGTIPSTTPVNDLSFSLTSLLSGSSALKGAMDEVRVWKTALSDSTVSKWMYKSIDNTHPDYSNLILYYPLNENQGTDIIDHSANKNDGKMIGVPAWNKYIGGELHNNFQNSNTTPDISLVQGTYNSHTDSLLFTDKIQNPQISIAEYEIKNYSPDIKNIIYAWQSGYGYTYDAYGNKIDSTFYPSEQILANYKLKYYGQPFEVLDPYEIGRYITPYGINLSLGPNGFTWIYDVTDYAPLLHGDVDFSAGNDQELIDIKFVMIKGTAPRNVLRVDRIWGGLKSYSYQSLSDDKALYDTTLHLLPDAKQFKVITRLSGHGQQSSNGQYPHCCEWKDNDHYLIVNGTQVADWHIFQYNDCALNPVFPQGGTWPGSREGWCPGDVVKDNDFEITNYIKADSVTIDYDITKVPADNAGMGNGNYVTNMDLIEYSAPNHNLDAEIYDVITPNNWDYYARKNPICSNPIVVIRNNGKDAITSLNIAFGVSGGKIENYNWKGTIGPMVKENIFLPVSGNSFWLGDGNNNFTVNISQPNGSNDEYTVNDTYTTHFDMPDLFNKKIVIWYNTNLRPQDYTLEVKDLYGQVMFTRNDYGSATLYKDTLSIPNGCYTLELTDANNMGLSYWAYTDQGNGYLQIHDINGALLKAFNPDCGHGIYYAFDLGEAAYVQDKNFDDLIALFPNPAGSNVKLYVNFSIGDAELQLFNTQGSLIMHEKVFVGDNYEKLLNTENLAPGTYFVRLVNEKFNIKKQFIKN